jgi:uncharacterized protein (DUF1330 family)
MTTYLVVEIEVTDPDLYAEYRAAAQSALADLGGGGRIIIRGGRAGTAKTESVEGDWNPERFVVVEFPTEEAARSFYYSERYQEALKLRLASSRSKAMLITAQEES